LAVRIQPACNGCKGNQQGKKQEKTKKKKEEEEEEKKMINTEARS